jgi:hypothetical protein
MAKKPTRGKPAGEEVPAAGGAEDLPERWSAQRKMELVLRLLRGEPLDAVSRESSEAPSDTPPPRRYQGGGLLRGRRPARRRR